MGISAAIVIGAVVSASSAAYQADQQKKAAKADADKREKAAAEEQARLDEIARNTKPEEESLEATEFGGDADVGSYQDFLVPKPSNKGAKSSAGVQANGAAGLNNSGGFNV